MILGGVLLLIALAAVVATCAHDGSSPSTPETTAPPVATTPTTTPELPRVEQHSGRIDPATISLQKTVTVPPKGTFLVVWYLGEFTGTYRADNASHDVQSSGDSIYTIESPGQTLSGTFRKADRSTKQALQVQIWKDGNLLEDKSTSDLFGEVTISSEV